MKRCPDCYEIYDEGEKFCDLDGQRLMIDPALSDADLERISVNTDSASPSRQSWLTGLVGVMGGIIICAVAYGAHSLWSMQSDPAEKEGSSYSSRVQEPVYSALPAPARMPEPTPHPSESPSPDPGAEPLQESSESTTAGAESQTVVARLNQGPISTGPRTGEDEQGERIQTIVQMNDGTNIEVDAAWEDGQGVWYRRGGLVSFVESQRVKAITVRAQPKPSPISAK